MSGILRRENDGKLAVQTPPRGTHPRLEVGNRVDLVFGLASALSTSRAHVHAGDLIGQLRRGVVLEGDGVLLLGVQDLDGQRLRVELGLKLFNAMSLLQNFNLGSIKLCT